MKTFIFILILFCLSAFGKESPQKPIMVCDEDGFCCVEKLIAICFNKAEPTIVFEKTKTGELIEVEPD